MSMCERAISNKTPLRQLTRGTLTASRRGSNQARLVRVPLPDKRTEGFEKLQAMLTGTHPNPRPPSHLAALDTRCPLLAGVYG